MENKILQMKQKPQAVILVENPLCNIDAFLKSYMKSIICSGKDCVWCKKIESDSYFDLIKINGYEETIKKEQILDLFQKCSVSGLESRGIKFYIIKGVEYATQQSVNALLKILEEPPTNTYAILTTRSLNLVIPTIRSRCQVFTLKSNLDLLPSIASQYNLTSEQISLVKGVYYSYEQLK
ncbi:hypothetical protein FACS1894166_01890 [Bacilli bacterium]|nr:hypothetical protein FACS1894166_01890 [Bacilli bacterium]